ncbi:AbfB domain-containing protein [Methylorubrum salsuginis]|uniref:Glyoxal oxidase N-terminus n=1 Tax=Methylorubrum salsuginis TaxID=414703 RepID=A0A1I4DXU3_9HYPH|nr:AbfB domain-containing protein [Methylorubrum salsuginis]SFK96926.1 Glyoxal oxidase N-terminus [Methylorubrum salsuginis]
MMRRDAASGRARARRTALLSATMLATGFLSPAQAAKFGIVVNPVQDPLMANLAIPDAAPTVGMWSGVTGWPMNAIHMSLLPSGKVVSFGTPGGNPGTQDGRTFDVWNPYAGLGDNSHVTLQGIAKINSFCAAQAFQADGSLLVSGGIFDNGTDKGSVVVNTAANGISAIGAQLANDRYYSTMLTLPNGQQLIMGGSYPYQGGWADPQGSIDKGLMTGMTPEIYDGQNWRSLFGAKSREAFGPDFNRFWYPRAWVAPNGKVFGLSSERMWYLDPTSNGSVTSQAFLQGQKDVGNAADAPNVGPASTAVMFAPGKILQVGGNAYSNGEGFRSSSRATVIDINGNAPAVNDTAFMNNGRGWANATVLPTGLVAVTGGSRYNDRGDGDVVLASEFWDPTTGRWSPGASNAVYRGYHSSAILMQNGALMVAGGGAPGPVANQNAELFYPPYLFTSVNGKAALAPRPQIVSLTTTKLAYGQTMQFEFASQNGVAQVVLIGLSSVTHSFNATQRRIPLTFTQADQTVTLQPPASGALAPPGYYQLVAIDQKGVPSPGVIVAVGNVAAPPQSAAPTVATAGGGTGGGTGGTADGGTGGTGTGSGTGSGTSTGGGTGTGTAVSLQASNFTNSYLTNVNGVARLVTPANDGDRQQSTFRLVAGLAGTGLSFQSSTSANQYLRHQNFGVLQQNNDGGDLFKQDATFTQRTALAGTCGCNTGACASYEAVNWPGYYVRHQNYSFYLAKFDGSDLFKQDASFCAAPPLAGGGSTGGGSAGGGLPASNGQWNQIGGPSGRVSIGSDGTVVTNNADNKTVWRSTGDGNWTQMPGTLLNDIAVIDATTMYGIGTDNNVYRYNGQNWTQVGVNARSISASSDGTVLIANGNGELWLKQANDNSNGWTRLPGQANRVAVMNANSLWHVGTDRNAYRGDRNGNWVRVGGDVADIAASPDGSVMVINATNGTLWRKVGDNATEAWTQFGGTVKAADVTIPNAQRAIMIDQNRNVFRW